jgi:uncharacterized RDD family membrane protein YckC
MSATSFPGTPQPTPFVPPRPPSSFGVQYRYAGLVERFIAALIDLIILAVVAIAVAIPFGLLTAVAALSGGGYGPWIAILWGPVILLTFAVWIVYFTYLEGTKGQTLGKRAMNLRVVSAATGRPPDFGHSLIRNLARIVDWLPAFYFVGFVTALLTPRKQRLGDLVGDTVVVRT